jgi:hypothetical protein
VKLKVAASLYPFKFRAVRPARQEARRRLGSGGILMISRDARLTAGWVLTTAAAGAMFVVAGMLISTRAHGATLELTNDGGYRAVGRAARHVRHSRRLEHVPRVARQSNAAVVSSRSGIRVRVSPTARPKLQCVVDYIEGRGIRIAAMRGYGKGTVRASLHPSGQALDINQTGRDRTSPHIPVALANAAGLHCDVVSGGTWGNRDTGHWNMAGRARYARQHRGPRA